MECLDWTGGQVNNDDSANDIRDMRLDPNHHLSGPIEVKGAEPGDILVVDILDLDPWPDREWGFTGIFEQDNGGGFLTDHFPNARKTIWDFDGVYTHSRHVEDVRFPGLAHPGIIGTTPSHDLLETWNEREGALIDRRPEDETAVNHETRDLLSSRGWLHPARYACRSLHHSYSSSGGTRGTSVSSWAVSR